MRGGFLIKPTFQIKPHRFDLDFFTFTNLLDKEIYVRYDVHIMNNFLTLTEARKNIFRLVKELEAPGKYFVLTEKGTPKAVLVSWEEFESLMETLEVMGEIPTIKRDFKEAREEYKKGEVVSLEEVEEIREFLLAEDSSDEYVPSKSFKKISKRHKKNKQER